MRSEGRKGREKSGRRVRREEDSESRAEERSEGRDKREIQGERHREEGDSEERDLE